jgi:hypothetical protein
VSYLTQRGIISSDMGISSLRRGFGTELRHRRAALAYVGGHQRAYRRRSRGRRLSALAEG